MNVSKKDLTDLAEELDILLPQLTDVLACVLLYFLVPRHVCLLRTITFTVPVNLETVCHG